MNKLLILLIASIISGILYRLGGIGKPFKSWMRDWLIPPLTYLTLLFFWQPSTLLGYLLILPAITITGAALTTYWDWLFGFDNFWFHGFMIGLATFPLYWAGIHWWAIGIRAIILAILVGGWSKLIGWDTAEEWGRGFIATITIPLLLI